MTRLKLKLAAKTLSISMTDRPTSTYSISLRYLYRSNRRLFRYISCLCVLEFFNLESHNTILSAGRSPRQNVYKKALGVIFDSTCTDYTFFVSVSSPSPVFLRRNEWRLFMRCHYWLALLSCSGFRFTSFIFRWISPKSFWKSSSSDWLRSNTSVTRESLHSTWS